MICARAFCLLAAGVCFAGQPLAVPFFKQHKNGCGAASVAMVMHYWNGGRSKEAVPAPERVYEQLYQPGQKGIPLAAMRMYLEKSGFRAFTLRGRWTDVEQHLSKRRPIIVALSREPAKGMHFAVLAGADEERVWLNDPTRKKAVRMKRADFERQWESAGHWMLLAAPATPAN